MNKLNCNVCNLRILKNVVENELSKSKTQQTDKRFANLEQRCIDLELALQHEKEKNVCENSWVKQSLISGNTKKALKDKNNSLIVKLNHKTLEISDMKAQLQDKTIANAEIRESLNKIKGSSIYSSNHVSTLTPKESVGSNDMVHNYYLEEAKKKVQIQKEQALNSKPSVQKTSRLPNTANCSKPKPRNFYQQLRNWPFSMSSRVTNKAVHIAETPRNHKPFLK
ncbi:hypothetical protein Tco_0127753 [Tanacetum coccineum]